MHFPMYTELESASGGFGLHRHIFGWFGVVWECFHMDAASSMLRGYGDCSTFASQVVFFDRCTRV